MDRRAGLRDSSGKEIMAIKLKITSHYINDITSPVILILPFLANSSRIGSRSASLMLTRRLKLLRFIFPLLLESIQRIRSCCD